MRGEWVVPFSSGAGLRAFQRQRVSPAPPRHLARIVPVFVPTWSLPQKARRGGVLGLRNRLANASPIPLSAPRGLCEKSPNSVAELCVAPRRGGGAALKCAARLPNDGSAAFPLAALAWCVAFPQRRLRGLPTPAPDWFVPCSSQKLLPLCPIGRGSRFVVRSSCRRCVLRAFHGFPARGRGDAGGEAAQNRARRFSCPTRLAEKTAALGFPPLAGVAPLL